ncbi:cyclin-dependent kinase 4 inhibitor C isoform X2 [Parambassis ranga]|nr:cyclin-dependent kinase 4 inhibitor C isoform X2 [Parambassis ranga]XP_028259624.1 cyclin-dependent kinase 4 inhibitor C isoform X2 [Parambassis ranga]
MAEGSLSEQLCNASACGKLSDVSNLLEKGAQPNGLNCFRRTALQVVMLGHSELIAVLLEAGADPNLPDPACGLTVTHDAAREGFIDSVRTLVKHGADVNLLDNHGNLPLHLAAKEGHLEVVQLLITRTADPQRANGKGYTSEQLASTHRKMDTATFIKEYLTTN